MPIYFIRAADDTGPIKIGYSVEPKRRLRQIQMSAPVKLKIIKIIEGDFSDEAGIHWNFADSRLYGEWFEFTISLYWFMQFPVKLRFGQQRVAFNCNREIDLDAIKEY